MAGEDWLSGHVVQLLAELGVRKGGTVSFDKVLVGPYVPDMPHRVAVVTPTSGPGDIAEGVADVRGFQIRTRWSLNDQLGAERAARQVHRLVKFADVPRWVGQVRVIAVPSSSDPAPLFDPDADDPDGTWVQTHLFMVSEFDNEGVI